MIADPVLENDWMGVANSADVVAGEAKAVCLLERDLVLWRDGAGAVHAWEDRCPHRGAMLSRGRVEAERLVCGYHGWAFGGDGKCLRIPAHPKMTPPRAAVARAFRAEERHGLVWVCLGEPRHDIVPFPALAHGWRVFIDGPRIFEAAGPRIVENFLDMSHFPFVHPGTLGDEAGVTEMEDYRVATTDDGLIATDCLYWQPRAGTLATGGEKVAYTYRVHRPLVASLEKLTGRPGEMHILLVVSPIEEFRCRAWKITTINDPATSDEALHAFNVAAFDQDKPIVECQRPKAMPLDPTAEVHQRCDALSVAYRRWLKAQGLTCGVTP